MLARIIERLMRADCLVKGRCDHVNDHSDAGRRFGSTDPVVENSTFKIVPNNIGTMMDRHFRFLGCQMDITCFATCCYRWYGIRIKI